MFPRGCRVMPSPRVERGRGTKHLGCGVLKRGPAEKLSLRRFCNKFLSCNFIITRSIPNADIFNFLNKC